MHERALISSTAAALLDQTGGIEVASVTLALSPETDPEVVAQAWRSVVASTSLAGARLNPVTRHHVLSCLDCGEEYAGDKLSICPRCSGNGLIVKEAPEVALDGWTMTREPV